MLINQCGDEGLGMQRKLKTERPKQLINRFVSLDQNAHSGLMNGYDVTSLRKKKADVLREIAARVAFDDAMVQVVETNKYSMLIKSALNDHYKKLYDNMLAAAEKQIDHLADILDKAIHQHNAKCDYNDQIYLTKKNIVNSIQDGDEFNLKGKSPVLQPLMQQLNGLAREIKCLDKKKPLGDYIDSRNRVVGAYQSLTKRRPAEKCTDFEMITESQHPVTRFFKNVFYAVTSALLPEGVGSAIVSKFAHVHHMLWNPGVYAVQKSVDSVEKECGIKPTTHNHQ